MALSRIYARLDAEGIKIKSLNLDFKEMSNAFQSAATKALELMQEHLSKLGGRYTPSELEQKLKARIDGLGPYKKIYEVWCATPVIREAELGFGLWILKMTSDWKPQGVLGLKDHGTWASFVYGPSSFSPNLEEPNFPAFATHAKAWPAILPHGEIVMFVSDGTLKTSGLVVASEDAPGGCTLFKDRTAGTTEEKNDNYHYPHSPLWHALVFRPNHDYRAHALHAYAIDKMGSELNKCEVFAYPIPFDAADGIEWEGASPTPDLDDTKAQLRHVHDTLGRLKRWSFGSDYWADADWAPESARKRLQSLKPMYVGLVPEPEGVFFRSSR